MPRLRPSRLLSRVMLGWALVVLSTVFLILIPVVWLLPLSGAVKGSLTAAFAIAGEVTFWPGAAILGFEFAKRFRARLNPLRLIRGRRSSAASTASPGSDRASAPVDSPAGGSPPRG